MEVVPLFYDSNSGYKLALTIHSYLFPKVLYFLCISEGHRDSAEPETVILIPSLFISLLYNYLIDFCVDLFTVFLFLLGKYTVTKLTSIR